MKSKRKRKSTSSIKETIVCFKEWLKGMGLEGNLTKDKFKSEKEK